MTALAEKTDLSTQPPKSKSGFRADIQGLRTVAVGLVLLYHAGVPFVPGGYVGVDVFFVISGFLITGILLNELTTARELSLSTFYARRAKRILPAAMVLLGVVALLTVLLLPRTRWDGIAVEIFGSAFNFVNWIFAYSETDYLQAGSAASPVQHFWTLAVEEQFYIVWPLLLVAAAYFARPRGRRIRRFRSGPPPADRLKVTIVTAALVITLPSLVYSVYLTASNSGPAYFVTTTRMYELGIGAIVAIFAAQISRISALLSAVLGWAGLAAVLVAGLLYTSATPFPGAAALLPTLGAAAMIVAGLGGRDQKGVGRLLGLRPMTWIGGISYSLYLWHWPLIVIASHLLGGLNAIVGLAVVAVSFVPAYLSYKYIERPFMKWDYVLPNKVALEVGLLGMLSTAMVAISILLIPAPAIQVPIATVTKAQSTDGKKAKTVSLFGAEALAVDGRVGDVANAKGGFSPTVEKAAADNPAVYADGCHQDAVEFEVKSCVYGSSSSDYTIAIVGDSHAAHWVPALIRMASENNFRLETYTKSACPLSTGTVTRTPGVGYDSCTTWGQTVIDDLTVDSKPDLVLFSSATYTMIGGGTYTSGLAGAWSEFKQAGVNFAVLLDTPTPGIDIPECVAENQKSLAECAIPKSEAGDNSAKSHQLNAAQSVGGVPTIDLSEQICPATQCSPVIGGVLVYRDTNHLTATYSRTLAPALEASLRAEKNLKIPKS